MFLGPENMGLKINRPSHITMLGTVAALAAITIILGFFPQIGLALVEPATASLLNLPNYISTVLGG
jgi:formate hydrogenlyase subunit 3/multisubunit Na+/H+ antiporter MnhD subunit